MALPLIKAPIFNELQGLIHGFTTREGGVSEDSYASLNLGWTTGDSDDLVEKNYQLLSEACHISRDKIVGIHQVHGADVVKVEGSRHSKDYSGANGDVLITNASGLLLTVRVADCFPILLVDVEHHAVAAVHAGWRGTLARVVPAALHKMNEEFKSEPSNLWMAIGPGIGICCFEVSFGIAALMEQNVELKSDESKPGNTGTNLDLAKINMRLAQGMGVRPERIWSAGFCTRCDIDRFFSYRRDGKKSGRSVGMVGWK